MAQTQPVKASFEKLAANFAEVLNSYLLKFSLEPQSLLRSSSAAEAVPFPQNFISQDKLEELVNKFERSVQDLVQIAVEP